MPPKKKDNNGSNGGGVTVRMYDVDFGDCFLLRFDLGSGDPQFCLIDCGTLQGRPNQGLKAAFADIAQVTNRKLALVVATHQHYDHISGFGLFADEFAKFQIGAVWLPWLDNPKDPKAAEWQRKQKSLAMALQNHFLAHPAAADDGMLQILYNNIGGPPMSAGASVLGTAHDLLVTGFRKQVTPAFLRGGDDGPALPGPLGGHLKATVLGPPATDEFLRNLTAPTLQEWRSLAVAAAGLSPDCDVVPFPKAIVDESRWQRSISAEDLADLRKVLSGLDLDDLETALASIDAARNNTSLVLLLEFNGKRMLFPGDAQWGNWEHWLFGSANAATAGKLMLEPQQQLETLSFYKVGHHGSHNATPRSALSAMPQGKFVAMCSTRGDVPKYPQIPMAPLMDALEKRTDNRLMRTDKMNDMPQGFTKGNGWVEYSL